MGEYGRHTKQQVRAERILDVASELLLRWGYKRVTIEDIARQADVGTGTIYLHWKNKEAIFEHVMLREAVAVWRELLQRIYADPQEVLVHRIMRSMFLIVRKRPLARAIFTRDTTLLGKLAQGNATKQTQSLMNAQEFMQLLRDLGLLRTDSNLPVQAYAFSATITGFTLIDPLLTEEDQVSLEEKAEAMAQTIRLAFEPEVLPTPAILQEQAVPRLTGMLEQICEYCEQQIRERTTR
ncbi:TetR family transcriptional regulator [Reticulibacter mediterranei]|uniref:TetR family transcriptional regulator n=1 Tax=Reticulibacter mediterranei TaxID=2778369 RepID=A0A8J3N0J2_9CHLR|nr:TetR/AcrR family transcriptional regulator [Reticulibacter mediterranei]GHO92962.1 TetR family transcriptional regulator [Reticulibacter mediterranei]